MNAFRLIVLLIRRLARVGWRLDHHAHNFYLHACELSRMQSTGDTFTHTHTNLQICACRHELHACRYMWRSAASAPVGTYRRVRAQGRSDGSQCTERRCLDQHRSQGPSSFCLSVGPERRECARERGEILFVAATVWTHAHHCLRHRGGAMCVVHTLQAAGLSDGLYTIC